MAWDMHLPADPQLPIGCADSTTPVLLESTKRPHLPVLEVPRAAQFGDPPQISRQGSDPYVTGSAAYSSLCATICASTIHLGSNGQGTFQELLARIAAEHERVVDILAAENRALRQELGTKVPFSYSKAAKVEISREGCPSSGDTQAPMGAMAVCSSPASSDDIDPPRPPSMCSSGLIRKDGGMEQDWRPARPNGNCFIDPGTASHEPRAAQVPVSQHEQPWRYASPADVQVRSDARPALEAAPPPQFGVDPQLNSSDSKPASEHNKQKSRSEDSSKRRPEKDNRKVKQENSWNGKEGLSPRTGASQRWSFMEGLSPRGISKRAELERGISAASKTSPGALNKDMGPESALEAVREQPAKTLKKQTSNISKASSRSGPLHTPRSMESEDDGPKIFDDETTFNFAHGRGSEDMVDRDKTQTFPQLTEEKLAAKRGSASAEAEAAKVPKRVHGSATSENPVSLPEKVAGLTSMDVKMASEAMVINPEHSRFLERWDKLTVFALAWVASVCPIQISMLDVSFDWLFTVNCAVDVIFFFDMILQFFVMYQKQTSCGSVLEHRPRKIAHNYLTSWFVVDFISVVPFDLISILSQSEDMTKMKFVKVLRLLRLVKLMRIMRASRLARRFEFRMAITYKQMALCRFFLMLLVITHWMANFWALTLVIQELINGATGEPVWTDVFLEHETMLSAGDRTNSQGSPLKLYIASVYFTAYTLTSVGYGDIGPRNIVERIVCTMMIVISGTSWAVVLGQVCGIVANMDADEQAFRTTMDELNTIMREGAFPMPMRQRLRGFFLSNKRAQRLKRHQQHLRNMSPGLQGEVAMQMNKNWLSKVSLFGNLLCEVDSKHGRYYYAFIVDVSLALRFEVHAQSEMFGMPQVLYILNRGLVSRPPRLHVQGAVWGVDFALVDRYLLETAESLALTYIELTCLTKESFTDLVKKYKTQCPALHQSVRRYCCWLATQRAVWAEARRRQRKLANKKERAEGGGRSSSRRKVQYPDPMTQLALVPAMGAAAFPVMMHNTGSSTEDMHMMHESSTIHRSNMQNDVAGRIMEGDEYMHAVDSMDDNNAISHKSSTPFSEEANGSAQASSANEDRRVGL